MGIEILITSAEFNPSLGKNHAIAFCFFECGLVSV